MKLENCGRCGLEAAKWAEKYAVDGDGPGIEYGGCPVCGKLPLLDWNKCQFSFRTERINAAAVAIFAPIPGTESEGNGRGETAIGFATDLIKAQDAAARVRWAEMQGE